MTAIATAAPVPRRLRPARIALWLVAALAALLLAGCDSVEERAEKHYQNGMELLAEDNPIKASLEFRNAIKLNDNHVGANLELGRIYEEQKNYTAAVHQYRKVIALDASQLDAHLSLAQILLAFNEVEQAVTSTLAAAQLAPEKLEVLTLEAVLAMRVGEMEKAKAKADKALQLDEDNGDAWIVLAAIARRDGDLETALERANEGRARDPENTRVLLFRIALLGEMNKNEELGRDLKQLVVLEPEAISYWETLARWQLANESYGEATDTLRELSELAPDDTDRQLDLVRLINRTQGREAAISELERLIELRKESDALGNLELAMADIEMKGGDREAAKARLERILSEFSDNADVVGLARPALARLHIADNNIQTALTLIQEQLATDPSHVRALTLRGRIRIEQERYDEAIRDLRAAEAEAPDDVETLRLLAVAHERNGSRDLAGDRLAAAVEASEHTPREVLAYARHLLMDDRGDAAETVIQEALARRRGDLQLIQALARVKLRNRDFSGVERIAQALQGNEATKDLGDRLLAAALAGQERYDETIEILEAGAEMSDNRGAYLSALVATHMRNDDLPAAKRLIEEALAENSRDDAALRLGATIALVEQKQDEAGEMFRRAVAAAPDRAINHLSLFRYHSARGEQEVAERALRAGLDTTDSNILRLSLAMVLERSGRIDEAIAEYEALYASQPGSAIVANNLASLITDNDPTPEQIDRAFTIAKRLRDTDVPHFQDTYAWLMYLRGDAEGAVEEFEEIVEKLGDNPIVQYHYGTVLAEVGRVEEARAALTKALELAGDRTIPQIEDAQAKLDGLSPAAAAE